MKIKKIFVSVFMLAAFTGVTIANQPTHHNSLSVELNLMATPAELIVKTWVFESIDYSESVNDIPAESREDFKNSMEDYIASMKGKATNQFMAGGKMSIYTIDYTGTWVTFNAEWKLNPAGTELTTTDEKGNTAIYTIRKLSADKLELTADGMTMIYSAKK